MERKVRKVSNISPELFETELPVKIVVDDVKTTREKAEYSKKITTAAVILAYAFVIFTCYEMHRLCDLSPISFIGVGIIAMLAICVRSYMKRAYQRDLVWMRVNQSRELSKLKVEFGDNFILAEQQMDVTVDN